MEKPIARIDRRSAPPPKKKHYRSEGTNNGKNQSSTMQCSYCNINPPPLKKLAPSGLDLYRIT